jgi:UDPglucose 6-dehydrogenase
MKPQNVCVIGCGYVGLVTGACLAGIGHNVICVDNDISKVSALKKGRIPIYEPGLDQLIHTNVKKKRLSFAGSIAEGMKNAEVIFIAVGTPPTDDGSADLTFIESVARDIAANLKKYVVVAEKSTVPVETGDNVEKTINRYNKNNVAFDMVSNPEFLREGTAMDDFLHPDRIVIGAKSKKAEKIMMGLYAPLKAKFLVTDVKSAELIKHASNSFLAVKISFINSVGRVCEQVGADATRVAEGMGLDPRIGRSFLHSGIGFGGFCLPKDLEAFYYISRKVGYDFQLLRGAKEVNEDQRAYFVKKIEDALWILKGKTIALLGIAFKPNTDDIRFAPALDIVTRLQAKGARVKAYDPVAMPRAKSVVKGVTFCKNAYDAVNGADCLALVTEWPEFKTLNMKKMKSSMSHALIVDGRNMFDPDAIRALGFEYHGMGKAR